MTGRAGTTRVEVSVSSSRMPSLLMLLILSPVLFATGSFGSPDTCGKGFELYKWKPEEGRCPGFAPGPKGPGTYLELRNKQTFLCEVARDSSKLIDGMCQECRRCAPHKAEASKKESPCPAGFDLNTFKPTEGHCPGFASGPKGPGSYLEVQDKKPFVCEVHPGSLKLADGKCQECRKCAPQDEDENTCPQGFETYTFSPEEGRCAGFAPGPKGPGSYVENRAGKTWVCEIKPGSLALVKSKCRECRKCEPQKSVVPKKGGKEK